MPRRSPREVHVGKTKLDGDPSQLLLFEPVGVDAGQSPDEGGLTVVDVAGGAENNLFHARAFVM